jgi:transposase InsO family protein
MQMLSIFGYPQDIKTDNGSPFNSNSFAHFASYSGFTHRRITPRWPRANAQTESFNKPLMKAVRAATVEGKCWKQELHKFLRQCRATPHPSTGFSPYILCSVVHLKEDYLKLHLPPKRPKLNTRQDETTTESRST